MDISICSYSFHRRLEAGRQDVFRYITDCAELGCTLLDVWNGHLTPLLEAAARPPGRLTDADARLSPTEVGYLREIKATADEAGLPFGCLAVDGAHIYEPEPEARQANRIRAYRWLNIAEQLGARQVRIDSGGSAEMPEHEFAIIVAGYEDLIRRGGEKGIEIVIENHWGASRIPENVVRMVEAVPGLGLLFDTGNWPDGMHARGWAMCARYARASHIKTFAFDARGNESTMDVPRAVRYLLEAGYSGCWGIESCPHNGDEYGAARQSVALVRRLVSEVLA